MLITFGLKLSAFKCLYVLISAASFSLANNVSTLGKGKYDAS